MMLTFLAKAPPRFVTPGGGNADPDWRRLHQVADAAYPALRDAMLAAIREGKAAVDLATLATRIAGEPSAALALLQEALGVGMEESLRGALIDKGQDLLRGGAKVASDTLTQALPTALAEIEAVFGMVNEAAATVATTQAGRRITGLTEESMRGVRTVLEASYREGQSPEAAASRLRDWLGLTERQADALGRYAQGLAHDGVSPAQQRARVAQRREQMITRRAEVVARTETITTSQQGQQQMWETSARMGIVPETFKRYWLVTPDDRLCPTCLAIPGLNAQGRALTEPFQTPLGAVMTPAAHPQCRCSLTGRM